MEKSDKKPWFREYLIIDAEKRLKTVFGSLSDKVRSAEMTRYYVKNVVSKLTPGLVPDDEQEIDDYIVDGAGDGGVDFIYPTEGRVLIVQGKYRSSEKYETAEDFTHFCEVIGRLYDAYKKKQKLNRKVSEALVDIDWESDYFELHFITLGRVSAALKGRAAKGPIPIKELADLEDRSELSLFDEQDLNIKLREALSAGEVLDQPIEIPFTPGADGAPWIHLESEKGRELYVGQVTGAQLAEMYRQYKYRLFAMNIRDYVGESTTNKGIIGTAVTSPDEFVFFNNGVSAVATQVEPDEKNHVLRCQRFSIIGAQTVRSLSKAQVKESQPLKDVRVMLRVMDFSLSKDSEFLADVTRFNNTQNSVKISDFRSNDPVQKDLHRRFADLNRAGKPYFYKNKRSRERAANKIPIGMEDLAKAIHAFRHGPDDIYGGTKYLFDISAKGGYGKVFGEPVSNMKNEDFKLLAGTYFLCEEINALWRERREADNDEGKNSPGLERRWVIYYAVGQLLRMVYGQSTPDLDADLRKLSKSNAWQDDTAHPVKRTLSELFKLAGTAVNKAYNQAAKQADFRHRNWFRSPDTLNDINGELEVIPEYRGLEDLALFERARHPSGEPY
jgi:hypothetical protein